MNYIENRIFDEINIGDTVSLNRTLSMQDIQLFAVMSGDVNPAHLDEEFAKSDMFQKIIAHGMWGGSLISTLLGTVMPGPGTIYLGQTLQFRRAVGLGDTITVTVTAKEKDAEKKRITFDCECINQQGKAVITGTAEVIAPTKKIKRLQTVLPQINLHDPGAHYRRLIALTSGLEPIRTAVVHPVGRNSLIGAMIAAQVKLIVPVLIGPEARIRAVAEAENIDLSPFTIIPTKHSHAAAATAVAMARAGEVQALMKGQLDTGELMEAVVAKGTGIRTERRMSHVAAMDVPNYPHPLFITDANINIYPNLEEKRDIVQNAIDLAIALGTAIPKVAILSAIENISSKLQSTLDAAALCKMADRGQIRGGILDGPLAFDDAISPETAKGKGLNSPVAGQANILVAPDLEAGTILAKQLEYFAHAQAADIVLGARVPIVLTSRADSQLTWLASCAVALLLAHQNK